MQRTLQVLLPLILLTILTGCESSDARVTRMTELQARQNESLAEQHQQVATATRTLIEADKQAREDFAAMHQRLQKEQSGINEGRDALEAERREIASWRHRDPILAGAVMNLGLLLACLLPFLVCLVALRAVGTGGDDPHVLNEVLIAELVAPKPLLSSHDLRIDQVRPHQPDGSC